MPAPWWLPFGQVPEIEPEKLVRQMTGPGRLQLLDVRTSREWRRGHIAGSVNVPITELRHRVHGLRLDRSRPVVAICLSAHRSVPAVRLLEANGFRQVLQLRGGMMAWRAMGLPTVIEGAR